MRSYTVANASVHCFDQCKCALVKGLLPCDWEVQTKVWSVCWWQVKLCDPLLHTAVSDFYPCCPA